MADTNPFDSFYSSPQSPISLQAGLFESQPALSTTDYFKNFLSNQESFIPSSSRAMQAGPLNPAENYAQSGERESNLHQDAHAAVMSLLNKSYQPAESAIGKIQSLKQAARPYTVEKGLGGEITKVVPLQRPGEREAGTSEAQRTAFGEQSFPTGGKKVVSETGESGPQESEQSKANRAAFLQSKQQQGLNVVAETKAAREAAGFDPEAGVWSPKDQGIPGTYETKNVDIKQTALNKSINQAYAGNSYAANLYGKAYQGMPTKGKTIFGEHGYAQSYPASQSGSVNSRAFTKAFTESELKKAKQQQA